MGMGSSFSVGSGVGTMEATAPAAPNPTAPPPALPAAALVPDLQLIPVVIVVQGDVSISAGAGMVVQRRS